MADERTVSVPLRLFTWMDVDEYFAELASQGRWPAWLRETGAFWDGVDLLVEKQVNENDVWTWLAEIFGPITVDRGNHLIFLERADRERTLDVRLIRETGEAYFYHKLRWAQRRVTSAVADPIPYPQQAVFAGGVSLCSFHSYKGGSGRTLHCVALAHNLASSGQRVLLVDADLEAPGITWMAAAQGARLDFSFEDFLSLLHGCENDDIGEAIAIARKFLLNQSLDGVFVLPARRSPAAKIVPRVDPVDLLVSGRSQYFLTESLAVLAAALGVDSVLIDLRAGFSELNAPLLLDPRVSRVFVTTISDQSIRGTVQVLTEVARRAPGRSIDDPFCTVLVTQFDEKRHASHVEEAISRFSQCVADAMLLEQSDDPSQSSDVTSIEVRTQPILSGFDPRLLALPSSWDEVAEVVRSVGLGELLGALADDLRRTSEHGEPDKLEEAKPDFSEVRGVLHEHTQRLMYAETAQDSPDFLTTESLENLVSAHRTDLPIEVVIGAKGSGKTFTYHAICSRRDWSIFARDAGVPDVEFSAPVIPVLSSENFSSPELLVDVRNAAAEGLGTGSPPSFQEIREVITDAAAEDCSDSDWRRIWLSCLAGAAGLTFDPYGAEGELADIARVKQAVFVIDGLEDLFRNFATDERQQQALRVLLTSVPDWFRSLRGRPLGLVIFVRRDLVRKAISQNSAQFLARYQSYQLKWDSTEVLRLVAWLVAGAGVIHGLRTDRVSMLGRDELSKLLLSVWGRQLGSDRSREPRSEAWFLAALTDFAGQIQARDVATFVAEAAGLASGESGRWSDRLLTPNSMKAALPKCSFSKISEIEEENLQVGEVFQKLRGVPVDERIVPFDGNQVGLGQSDVDLLKANGVIFEDEGKYWMPEIYRIGLGFKPVRGKSRVLAIAKRVARMSDSR